MLITLGIMAAGTILFLGYAEYSFRKREERTLNYLRGQRIKHREMKKELTK